MAPLRLRIFACALAAAAVNAAAPACKLSIQNATEEPIYVQSTQGCGPLDYPDYSARFLRAADGSVTLLDSNSQGYHRSVRAPGGTFFVRDCSFILVSGDTGPTQIPRQYNNSLWLQAFWASPDVVSNSSGRVDALVHVEFHGELATANASLCPSGNSNMCWYANTLSATSTDGGAHFDLAPYADRTVIVSPSQYVPDGGRQGMTENSNIVQASDGAWYVLILRDGVRDAAGRVLPSGICVWQSRNVSDGTAWRGWDGAAFTVKSVNPYTSSEAGQACNVTGPSELRFSLVWSDVCGVWLNVGLGTDAKGNPAFVYATSPDLFTWSDMVVLRTVNANGYPSQKYASIVDVDYAGAGTNYVHAGATPHLYYTRLNRANDRDLVRQQLLVEVP